MTSAFASGADESYGYHLLNLLGSLKANSDVFDHVIVFDLGLSAHQRGLLDAVRDVEVRTVPPFVEHWAQGFTWKPWIWTHLDGDELVLWVDAGATILRSLEPILEEIRETDSFLVSQAVPLGQLMPRDWYGLYALDESVAKRDYAAAGIIGFRVGSAFYQRVIVATYDDCIAGRSLGFSPDELRLNRALGWTPPDEIVVRDCPAFRHDQSVLNAHLFKEYPDAVLNDVWQYAGFLSPRDHPQQLIWHHRRRGNMACLARVPYERRSALRGRAFAIAYRVRWWRHMHVHLFRRSTYVLKARKLARSLRRDPQPSAPI